MEDYLEDATPCTECGKIPFERIEKCPPIIICGIETDAGYGTQLICMKCKKKTVAYPNPQDAFRAWNERVNKQEVDR